MTAKKEICYGCGAAAPRHPMVAVNIPPKIDPDVVPVIAGPGPHGAIAVACCEGCWKSEEHQTVRRVVAHFYLRDGAEVAVMTAGGQTVGA